MCKKFIRPLSERIIIASKLHTPSPGDDVLNVTTTIAMRVVGCCCGKLLTFTGKDALTAGFMVSSLHIYLP